MEMGVSVGSIASSPVGLLARWTLDVVAKRVRPLPCPPRRQHCKQLPNNNQYLWQCSTFARPFFIHCFGVWNTFGRFTLRRQPRQPPSLWRVASFGAEFGPVDLAPGHTPATAARGRPGTHHTQPAHARSVRYGTASAPSCIPPEGTPQAGPSPSEAAGSRYGMCLRIRLPGKPDSLTGQSEDEDGHVVEGTGRRGGPVLCDRRDGAFLSKQLVNTVEYLRRG